MLPIPFSPNFSAAEVSAASAPATRDQISVHAQRIARTLAVLERIRAQLGNRRITITSLLRTAEENASLPGASASSSHLRGEAADIVVEGMTSEQVMRALAPHWVALGGDQLIKYGSYVHVGLGPKARGQLNDKTSGTLRTWVPSSSVSIAADATRTATPSTPEDQMSAQNNGFKRWALGLLAALAAAAVAYVQSGGK